jgi:predicted nucleic-acid-binding Zn-ribbon protein
MILTQEQQEKVTKWLREKLGMRSCPSCGQLQGFLMGAIIAAPEVKTTGEGMALDMGNSVPFVPIACRNCGNVRLFSAIVMGLISEDGRMDVTIDGGSHW